MSRQELRDVRRSATAVGLGLYLGKELGSWLKAFQNGILDGVFATLAQHGSVYAKQVCEKFDISYKKSDDDSKAEEE